MPSSAASAVPVCLPVEGLDPCGHCGARHLSVCGALAEEGLRRLAGLAHPVEVAADAVLMREGDPADQLINITAGAVRVSKLLADGRRQIVGFLFAGDFLGLASGETYPFSAEAIGPVSVCRFRRAAYRGLLAELPALEGALLDRSSDDLRAAQNHMLLLGRKTATERVASFLLDVSRRSGEGSAIELPMSRAEIADYLGLTIETVSRTLTRMKTAGVISLPGLRSARVERPDRLAALASGEAP